MSDRDSDCRMVAGRHVDVRRPALDQFRVVQTRKWEGVKPTLCEHGEQRGSSGFGRQELSFKTGTIPERRVRLPGKFLRSSVGDWLSSLESAVTPLGRVNCSVLEVCPPVAKERRSAHLRSRCRRR
jgi:hypothetical protein